MMDQQLAPCSRSRIEYDDGRGRFPDRIQAPAPIGFRDSIRRAAAQRGISSAEFIRDAIEQRLREVGSIATAMGA